MSMIIDHHEVWLHRVFRATGFLREPDRLSRFGARDVAAVRRELPNLVRRGHAWAEALYAAWLHRMLPVGDMKSVPLRWGWGGSLDVYLAVDSTPTVLAVALDAAGLWDPCRSHPSLECAVARYVQLYGGLPASTRADLLSHPGFLGCQEDMTLAHE